MKMSVFILGKCLDKINPIQIGYLNYSKVFVFFPIVDLLGTGTTIGITSYDKVSY